MDDITERLVAYTQAFSGSHMTESATCATVDHLFDSVACAIPGSAAEPARITARVARTIRSDQPATVFGYGVETSPEIAALANAMMVRTFDYNDGLGGRSSGHASDMISGVLAAAEVAHAPGNEVVAAIALSYEILAGVSLDVDLSGRGFDQGTFMNVGVALAAGKLWGLNSDQLGNAASLAIVPNLPLSVSRWGDLSMMKGCATAFSTRNGVFAAMLAREGFTSAPEPFAGIYGLHHITGPFEAPVPVSKGKLAIESAYMKALPAENNVQGLLALLPRIREFSSADDIESVDVVIADSLVVHLADEPKYDPHTRETADHSLPYMMAVGLVDGKITLDSYSPERYSDLALRPIMRKFHVTGSKEFSVIRKAQNLRPATITVRTKDGRVWEEHITSQRGLPDNPLTRDDLNAKLDICTDGLPQERREQIREAWWNVGKANDIGEPIQTLVGFRSL